jgi:hypothetical protein
VTVDRGGTYTRWDVPRFCGAPGAYDELHTLSFVNTYADGEEWNRAVHAFIRGGRHVTRLVDGVTGPSCNVVDLYLLLLRKVERIPENLIDLDNLRHAARFTEALGMRFDGNFSGDATQNLDDWRENVLKPYFLLQATRINGREGLMPLLPTNLDGSIYTGRVGPHATLTELDLDLSTWDLQFLSLADRRPICAQMMWRQQADGIDSIVRTTEVRFRPPYNAPDGPFEQHDLSEFACSELHIAKVGAYAVAHRALVHHTLKVDAIPGNYNSSVADGMIVRVLVPRAVDGQIASTHDYLYRVVSIEKDLGGTTVFNLVHFPLDAEGRSAVAMAVTSANPSGLVLPIAKTGPVCDVNSSTDTTDLLDDSLGDDYWDLPGDEMFDIPIDGPPLDEALDSGLVSLGGIGGGGGGGGGPVFPPDSPTAPPLPEQPGPDQPPPGPGGPPEIPPVPPGCVLYYISKETPFGKVVEAVVECPPPNEEQPNPDKKPATTPPPGQPGTTPPPTPPGIPWGPPGAPSPGMQGYDIAWEQYITNVNVSTGFDCAGNPVTSSSNESYEPPADNGGRVTHYATNVQSWVHVGSGTLSFKCETGNPGSAPQPPKQNTYPLGISAFAYATGSVNQAVGGYQNGGSASGPGYITRTWSFTVLVRNFQIRRHGSGDPWQPMDPGPGHDGDNL